MIDGILAEKLRVARKQAGMTQEEASAKLGLARTTLVAMEAGQRNVRALELQALGELYQCDFSLPIVEVERAEVVLSARKRVLKAIASREPDLLLIATLRALGTPRRDLERMCGSLLRMLIEMEEQDDQGS